MAIRIALAGNPNCGKTTLFNALTGSNQFVGNWPGVTVEKKEGKLKGHKDVIITDLPGIYSLSPYTLEEVVARNYILNEKPDAILNIVDGTNLERNLYLTTQLMELGIPVIMAINMMDLVQKNGDNINIQKLSAACGCPVYEISALKGTGIKEASDAVVKAAQAKAVQGTVHKFNSKVEGYLNEIETLLGFISRQNDVFRASFGRRATPHLRQCIFIGTTNAEHGYLRDTTGNRRFFPVKVSGNSEKKPWQITQNEIDQIWAEALVYYRNKEPLILDEQTEKLAKKLQREAMETDEREGMVREYLETLLPVNWNEMSLYERRNFLDGSEFGEVNIKGEIKRQKVCNMEIWCECFGKAKADLKRIDANAISAIMAKIEGWQKMSKKSRFGIYGAAAGYERTEV